MYSTTLTDTIRRNPATATGAQWRSLASIEIDKRSIQFLPLVDVQTLGAASLLLALLRLTVNRATNSTYKGVGKLAGMLDVDPRTIHRWWTDLASAGYVEHCGRQHSDRLGRPRSTVTRRLAHSIEKLEALPYFPLPVWAMDREWSEQAIVSYLIYRCGERDHCDIGIGKLSRALGLSETGVRRSLSRLVDGGLIARQTSGSETGRIVLLAPQSGAQFLPQPTPTLLPQRPCNTVRGTPTVSPQAPLHYCQTERKRLIEKIEHKQTDRNAAAYASLAGQPRIVDQSLKQVIDAIASQKLFRKLYEVDPSPLELLPVLIGWQHNEMSATPVASLSDALVYDLIVSARDPRSKIDNPAGYVRSRLRTAAPSLERYIWGSQAPKLPSDPEALQPIWASLRDAMERKGPVSVRCSLCRNRDSNQRGPDGRWLLHDHLYLPVCRRCADDHRAQGDMIIAAGRILLSDPQIPCTVDAMDSALDRLTYTLAHEQLDSARRRKLEEVHEIIRGRRKEFPPRPPVEYLDYDPY